MKQTKYGKLTYNSSEESTVRDELLNKFLNCPIPNDEILSNLGLFINSKNLSRLLFINYIYKKIIDTQGIIMEFGTRWGQNLSIFTALRGIYEPYNRHRKIVGLDTFEGFKSISKEDGNSKLMKKGQLAVTKNYEKYLENIIRLQERDNPLSHIKKFEILKGDATVNIKKYLKNNPQTIISLAYFDLDLYEPTKKCLYSIKSHLVKGSILVFDELNDPDSPGETKALDEVIGLNNIKLKRYRYTSRVSYYSVE